MIMGFRISFGVFLMLCSSQISSFIQGQLILPAPITHLRDPAIVSGSHSGFGSTFQVLALVSLILNIARAHHKTTLPPPLEGCPSEYIMYTDRCGPFCYRFETRNCTSFTNARQVCARDGGDLLNVDPCYYDFFKHIAETGEGCDPDVWMGASSATPEVNYITVRGNSVPQNTVLWAFKEPRPLSGGGCVDMDAERKYGLEDARCVLNKQFFCQVIF